MAEETADEHTHYLPFFTSRDPKDGLQKAVCGAWIPQSRHRVLATCPKCEAWFAALEKPREARA